MPTLESINNEYIALLRDKEAVQECKNSIAQDILNKSYAKTKLFLRVMSHADILYRSVKCTNYPYLTDSLTIGILYRTCINAIEQYKEALQDIGKGSVDASRSLLSFSSDVMKAQSNYDEARQRYSRNYNYEIKSEESLLQFIQSGIDDTLTHIEKQLIRDLTEAKKIIDDHFSLTLCIDDPLCSGTVLPEEISIGRYYEGIVPLKVLYDLGIKEMVHKIGIDIKNSGNILISTDLERLNDDEIDSFVIAYIFRYIAQFPTGCVNVHIFDKNSKYIIRRLNSSFQKDTYGDSVKRIVQLHSEMLDLATINNVVCEDIIRKTSVSQPDLFSIYEKDQSDVFNLIVLKDGLVEMNGAASTEVLETISSLIKVKDVGHRSGIRFLIIDNSDSVTNTMNQAVNLLLKSIKENCQITIEYKNGSFFHGKNKIELLNVSGNINAFVEERSRIIAEKVSKKERTYITLKDVNSKYITETVGSIMAIPVGKSGQEIVELPFSCRDEDGTIAGQCIGYMAIGQSGSGKSSFFHSIVLNGCLRYSPKELQFWLLDFKFGGASSKYSFSGLPHIRIVAENNKVDDALCLFQMIAEEMDRRNKAFNSIFVDNIVDYNMRAVESSTLEYFPRIIIAIDEIQEIFRDENAAILQKQIAAISVRMRSAGMHFVMVAQNLSDGKSYMLKEAFLPSASGRICFRVAQNIPRDSGFGEDFVQRKDEIAELKTGEAYISYGKGTMRKVKIAYASAEDMIDQYFQEIKNRYPEYKDMKPLVIGSKNRLSINDELQREKMNYGQAIYNLHVVNKMYFAIVAEDSYRMSPIKVCFSQHENSTLLLLGDDKKIASSICATIAAALIHQDAVVHLFNGDRTPVQENEKVIAHPFMHVCQRVSSNTTGRARVYRLNQFGEVLTKIYAEYLKRQKEDQEADDIMPHFEAIFFIVNDLFGIESFVSNQLLESCHESDQPVSGINRFDFLTPRITAKTGANGQFKDTVQNIVATLIRAGYRYNIHLILGIQGDPSVWRENRLASEVNNVILFNPTQFTERIDNMYYVREMLKNIANEGQDETMAVSRMKHSYSKIRPIMIDMTNKEEAMILDFLLGGDKG